MTRRPSRDLPRGIRRTKSGYEANVGVKGETKWKTYPADTPVPIIVAWRQEQKNKAKPKEETTFPSDTATLGKAIATYLPAKAAMPSYKDRVREINDWIAVFGANCPRTDITRVRLQAQRDAWVLAGKSASWINNRLNALSNLYTVLDGRRAPNPAREVPQVDRPDPEPRGLPYPLIRRILAALPERSRRRKGESYKDNPGASLTRARLAVIAYTGLAHVQVKRLEPHDINWSARWVFVRSRKKGSAGRPKGRVKPLTPEGLAALKRFAALNAWGDFSNSSVWKSFQRACKALAADETIRRRWQRHGIDLTRVRPYDLRHSYASAVLAGTGNLAETQQLMAHADVRTTMRYVGAAVPQHLQSAIDLVSFGGAKVASKHKKLGKTRAANKKAR